MPTEAGPDRAELYARHYLGLVRLAVHLVDDLETAEDVVQDVFAAWPSTVAPDDALRYLRTGVVSRLPARQREVVILRFYLELSVPDTAAMLGVRPTAVTTALSRALDALAHHLGENRHDV